MIIGKDTTVQLQLCWGVGGLEAEGKKKKKDNMSNADKQDQLKRMYNHSELLSLDLQLKTAYTKCCHLSADQS